VISLHVPGTPVAQPRAKATTINGYARMYTPTTASAFKATVVMVAEQSHPGPPLDGPLRLEVVFVLDRPKSKIWKRREMPRELHSGRPDIDNLAKAVMDSLKGIAWRDDAQVATLCVTKWVASGYEQPHTQITIEQMAVS
jgi:Holliday junction resolvase RusA-like endonuclease